MCVIFYVSRLSLYHHPLRETLQTSLQLLSPHFTHISLLVIDGEMFQIYALVVLCGSYLEKFISQISSLSLVVWPFPMALCRN